MNDSEWFKALECLFSDWLYIPLLLPFVVSEISDMHNVRIILKYYLWAEACLNGFETIWGVCTPHAFAVRTGWSFPVLQRVSDNVFAYRCDIVTASRIPLIFLVLFPLFWLFSLIRVTTTLSLSYFIPSKASDCLYLEVKCCLWRKVRPSPRLHQGTNLAYM